MQIHRLRPTPGSRHTRKRVGRGDSSGSGSYSGKGRKGQKARPGRKPRLGFEGGQLPFIRRFSQRGFTNKFRVDYNPVSLARLAVFPDGALVTLGDLVKAKIIKDSGQRVKILGDGEISKALTIEAHKISRSARAKLEAAGGKFIGITE